MKKERDTLIDTLRGLTMIHIVCVIHVIYWFVLFNEPLRSILLFEMPAIFFIAGASQSLKQDNKTLSLWKETMATVVNRTKRVILPYYVFLIVLYIVMAICTWGFDGALGFDLTKLSIGDIIKTIATGGSDNINFFGYTWFIYCYYIVSSLFPLYKRIVSTIRKYPFFICNIIIIVILSNIDIPIVEKEIKNIPIYSLFFMGGYIFYRKTTKSVFIMITSVSTILTIIFFLLDIATPMVDHKFPADYVFMCYGISAISLLSLVFSRIHIPQCRIISLWNTQGYNIYLYQTITFSIAVAIFNPLVTTFQSNIAIYIVYAITVFIISTILALIIAFLNTFGH